jgi:hypothetical protein
MKTKLRALVGGVALLLVLAACYPGINSQYAQSYEVQATVTKGKVDLDHGLWDLGPEGEGWISPHGLQGPWSYNRVSYEGNGTASVDLSFSSNKGNWQVSGKWLDGDVRMEFSGKSEYLTALLSHCLSNVDMNDVDGQLSYWDIQDDAWGYDFGAEDCGYFESAPPAPGFVEDIQTGTWIKGGCIFIPTMYRSLNSAYVGTGHALLLVCQNSATDEYNPVVEEWNYPSYMEVWIPDTTWISEQAIGDVSYYLNGDEDQDDCFVVIPFRCADSEDEYNFQSQYEDNAYYTTGYFENDNSPFRNYYAGGTNTNRSGKWIVQTRYNNLAIPSALPTEPAMFNSTIWFMP